MMTNTKKTNQHFVLVALADMEPRDYQRATSSTQLEAQ